MLSAPAIVMSPSDAPEPKVFDNQGGWMIGEPDLIVEMPEPYFVSDEADDLYAAFYVDLTDEMLPEDVWITRWSSWYSIRPSRVLSKDEKSVSICVAGVLSPSSSNARRSSAAETVPLPSLSQDRNRSIAPD